MEKKTTSVHRIAPRVVLVLLLLLQWGGGVRAQTGSEPCTSFVLLTPDPGPELTYTFPLHYGAFADVEVGALSDNTVQLEVTVFEQSSIQDRRLWILIPGRTELLTDILDVRNLLEIGSPLLVRMTASAPVSAMLVRR